MPIREAPADVNEPKPPHTSTEDASATGDDNASSGGDDRGSRNAPVSSSRWVDYDTHELLSMISELEDARRDVAVVFSNVDLLVTPTTPIPATTIAELQQNPDLLRPRELLLLRNTRPANVWGLPAISIPCGFTSAGLPIGLQIIGPRWGEAAVLRLAEAYEQATAWHKREPLLF